MTSLKTKTSVAALTCAAMLSASCSFFQTHSVLRSSRATVASSPRPAISWLREFGGLHAQGTAVAADATGVYVGGLTSGTLPGQRSAGGSDAFVEKYTSGGRLVWTRQFGSSGDDGATAIAADATGVYVGGLTSGTLPGQRSAGSSDAFVEKYTPGGRLVWARQFGSSRDDRANALAVAGGLVYVAGTAHGTLPRAGNITITSYTSFVASFNSKGSMLWIRQFGTSHGSTTEAAAADGTGVYIGGSVYGALPGQQYGGSSDGFIRKYERNGALAWTNQFGTAVDEETTSLATGVGLVYGAGITNGSLASSAAGHGGEVAFVVKYTPGGRRIGVEQLELSQSDEAGGLAVASAGVFLTGSAGTGVPGAEIPTGNYHAFLVRLADLP